MPALSALEIGAKPAQESTGCRSRQPSRCSTTHQSVACHRLHLRPLQNRERSWRHVRSPRAGLKAARIVQKPLVPEDIPPIPASRSTASINPRDIVGGDFFKMSATQQKIRMTNLSNVFRSDFEFGALHSSQSFVRRLYFPSLTFRSGFGHRKAAGISRQFDGSDIDFMQAVPG